MRSIGLEPAVIPPPPDAEPEPRPGETAASFAVRAAKAKACGALALIRQSSSTSAPPERGIVIGADTVVTLGGDILGKPRDKEHAFAMLSSLAGKTHQVVTGCALLPFGKDCADAIMFAVSSRVSMWDCPKDILMAYAAAGDPKDKAGAYGIQSGGAFLVERLEGSWSNVAGLPLAELVQALVAMQAIEALSSLP